ncbi:MAG TPA: TIGR02996 domain-containing protein, partial [Kofleriaceae bacterium]
MLHDLLARIVANPEDEGARAVYADALTEADDPRGELIHLELALAKLGIETMDDLVFSPLEGDALAHATQLLRSALVLRPDNSYVRRGFTTTAQSSDPAELARAIETSPIDTLVPEFGVPIAKLLELPLARIRKLYLRPMYDPENLPALFAAMPQLESLAVWCPFDLAALEPCVRLRSLTGYKLDLDVLSALPCARTLTFLCASQTPNAFASGDRLPLLERLELDDIIDPVADRLPRELLLRRVARPERLATLPAMASVEALEMRVLEEDAMLSIITSRYVHAVKKLWLRGPASERAFRALIDKRGAQLEWLSLENAPLPGETVAAIVRAHRLVHLDWTPFGGSPRSAAFADEPAAASLRSLVIFGAYLGDDGVATLAASPHLANLRRLGLGKNAIYARGRTAISESKHLRGVIDLDLCFNGDTAYLVLAGDRVTEEALREVLRRYFDLDRRGGLAGDIEIDDDAFNVAAHARLVGVESCTRMVRIPRAKAYDALP